jgi:hypothetical protein
MSIGGITGVLLPFLLLFLIVLQIITMPIDKTSLIRGRLVFFRFGMFFILLGFLNLVTCSFNDFFSISDPRTPLIIFLTGLVLLFFQNPNTKYLKIISFVYLIIVILNGIIVICEIVFFQLDRPIAHSIQSFFRYGTSYIGLVRQVAGVPFLRPIGLLGAPHIASMLVAVGVTTAVMLKARKIGLFRRLTYWFILVLALGIMGSGQSIIAAIATVTTFEFLFLNNRKRLFFLAIFFPFLILLLSQWAEYAGHVEENDKSLISVYEKSIDYFPHFTNNSCFIFGCSLKNSEIVDQNVVFTYGLLSKLHDRYMIADFGLIMFLNSYGVFYFITILSLLITFYNSKYIEKETRIILIASAAGYLMTLAHYIIAFTGTGFPLMCFNAYYIFYRQRKTKIRYPLQKRG